MKKKVGVFGWGVVAPGASNIEEFAEVLAKGKPLLDEFSGFGPSGFLVGNPKFDFGHYKDWIISRFEPRKFSQLESKMGPMVKYAIGAFIQSLEQNRGIENFLSSLGAKAHVYVGTGLGDLTVIHEIATHYNQAQFRWNYFWCQDKFHSILRHYRKATKDQKQELLERYSAPSDPGEIEDYLEKREAEIEWYSFWVNYSEGLKEFLEALKKIENVPINSEDIEKEKKSVIRKKRLALKKLLDSYGAPTPPWESVSPNLLWNIANIPAAQISMLGKITGTTFAPIAACAGFGTALKLAYDAIQREEAKIAVVGMTDPPPHPLTVGAFYGARVIAADHSVSKPLTQLKGTHVSGGACIWIVGDADFLREKGFRPLGLEIVSISQNSNADHIITPSLEGPHNCILEAVSKAGIDPNDLSVWDMHATATPGDWPEFNLTVSCFPQTMITAQKGIFGHGMSVCGGWELTALFIALSKNSLFPTGIREEELHPIFRNYKDKIVLDSKLSFELDGYLGKINMGVGGVNTTIICKPWD